MKTENLSHCPACQSAALGPYQTIKDYYFSQEEFKIVECQHCGLRLTQDRPTPEEIGRYYDSANYASHESGKKASLFLKVYQTARNYMLGTKYELVRQFKPEWKQVLDYGTGEGFFTEFLLGKGKEADGIEPSETARQNFYSRTGKKLYAHVDELPVSKSFQVITLWHVLEHIHALRETMQLLTNKLETNGIIVIAVPNQQSKDLETFGTHWAAWDVPRHLYHWDINSLTPFMNSLGLKNIHKGQLPLDPIYIGMISARYQNKSTFSGLLTGLKSYFHGKNNPEQGSTLLTIWMKS